MADKFKDHCGVFAVFNHSHASEITTLGLYALQHRGQESVGIIVSDGKNPLKSVKNYGLVNENFSGNHIIELDGNHAIGHVRYSTSGEKKIEEIQPFMHDFEGFGEFAVAHNGNLINAKEIKKNLENHKHIFFQSNSDTECILRLMQADDKTSLYERFKASLRLIKGAYSLVAMEKNVVYATRDPNGIRPLSLGKLGNSWVLASETCAFDIINAEFIRDIKPGEIIKITENGIESEFFTDKTEERFCVFEYIYFARPDSNLLSTHVYEARKNMGRILAQKHVVKADLVSPVPDSGVPAALGYAEASGIPFDLGIIRNHYTGRTFINPTQQIRENKVKLKHNPNTSLIRGKSIVLVDDSIVRGTTSKKVVKMLFEAGAREVHMRISSPPTSFPCFYGIDTPTKEELIINRFDSSIEKICEYLGCTSLAYLDISDVYLALKKQGKNFCDACFTGNYFV